MRLYKRDKVWWVDMVIKGARTRRSTNCTGKRDAKMIASQILADVLEGTKRERMRVDDGFRRAWAEHWSMLRYKGLDSTLAQINDDLGNWFVDELNTERLCRYRDGRLERGDAPATVKRKLACISRMLTMACEWGVVDVKPTMPTLRIAKDTRVRSMTRWEIQAAWGRLDVDGDTVPFQFMLETGLRLSELVGLQWRDVHDLPGSPHIKVWETKSGKARAVPLTDEAIRLLPERSASLPNTSVWTYSVGELRAQWKAAGITNRIHDLRHTYAVRMLDAHDIYKVQQWLGHASVTTTERYCKLST